MQGQRPCPRSAERGTPLCFIKRRRGSKGEPSPGVPPFFYSCTCAPILWAVVDGLSCLSTPFLWCLPKETVSSRQRKALFYLGGSTIRVSATSRWSGRSSPDFGRGLVLVGGGCGCAVFLGGSLWPLLPIPPHFFALAQRNGVEPQRNALLGAATGVVRVPPASPTDSKPQHYSRLRQADLSARSTHRVQINLTHQFVPLGLTPKWERWAGPPR